MGVTVTLPQNGMSSRSGWFHDTLTVEPIVVSVHPVPATPPVVMTAAGGSAYGSEATLMRLLDVAERPARGERLRHHGRASGALAADPLYTWTWL